MRVGYFVETPVEHNMTGGVRSFLNLIEVLVKKGVEPYVVTSEEWAFTEKLSEMDIPVLVVKMLRPFVGITEHVRFEKEKYLIKTVVNKRAEIIAYKWLKQNQVGLIHVNSQFAGVVGCKVARKLNVPYIYHIREFLEEGFGVTFYNSKLLYDYIAGADVVVGISQAIKHHYENKFNREVQLVYNGLPVNENTYHEYRTLFEKDEINIATVGRVTLAKGQVEAVKAVSELVSKYQHKKLRLHIIGYEGKDVYELGLQKFVSENGLEKNVIFHPFMKKPIDILEKCDIGVICSKAEAFGRVTIEYMMASLFTIGSNSGGTLEIIENGESGLLYQLGDEHDLAEKINWVIENPKEANEIAKRGQERAVKVFSILSTAENILDIYNTVRKDD